MNTNTDKELNQLFDEYGDTLVVADFGITPHPHGDLLTHVHRTEDGQVQYWSGNMDADKHSAEIVLTDEEKEKVKHKLIELL